MSCHTDIHTNAHSLSFLKGFFLLVFLFYFSCSCAWLPLIFVQDILLLISCTCILQAYRHFYVLATEARWIQTVDVDTGLPVYAPLEITVKETEHHAETSFCEITPCLLPERAIVSWHTYSKCGYLLTLLSSAWTLNNVENSRSSMFICGVKI